MKSNLKAVISLLLVVCLLASVAVGCASSEKGPETNAPAAESNTDNKSQTSETPEMKTEPSKKTDSETTNTSGRNDVIIGQAQEPVTLDPNCMGEGSGYSVACNVFEGLVWITDDLKIEPLLAKSWDISEDGTVYTFHLQEGVKFHNGEPLTADDVVFSFDRAAEGGYAGSVMSLIKEYKAVDESTFEVTLNYAYAPALELFGCNWLRVVNKKAVEEAGESFSYNPAGAGTGPYEFKEWNSGSSIILTRNDNYWRTPASIETIEFRQIPDTTSLTIAIETGDIDYGNIQVADIEYFESHDEVDYMMCTSLIENYVGFNCKDEHFQDYRLRQAVSYCIDRMEALIVGNDSELGGKLTATDIPADGFGCNTDLEIVQMDLDKAKELMTEAGYPDGFDTQIYVANVTARKNMATYIQAQLAKVGINAELVVMEQSAVLDEMRNGNAPMFLMGYSSTSGDADFFLYPQHHSGENFNYFQYYNDEMDAKLEAARQSIDPAEREALYKEIQEELYEMVPSMPMYHVYLKYGFNADLSCTCAPIQRIYVYNWHWN